MFTFNLNWWRILGNNASINTILAALGLNLGVGFLLGFAVGYALKKIAKLALIILGFIILVILFLHYKGIIVVNYDILAQTTSEILQIVKSKLSGLIGFIGVNVPFAGGFMAGFIIGLKKG